jgi:hypothetical protein
MTDVFAVLLIVEYLVVCVRLRGRTIGPAFAWRRRICGQDFRSCRGTYLNSVIYLLLDSRTKGFLSIAFIP